MKIYKRCLSVLVACLIAATLAIPASAANTTVEKIKVTGCKDSYVTISNCTSRPFSKDGYNARTADSGAVVTFQGSDLNIKKVTYFTQGGWEIYPGPTKGSLYIDSNYGWFGLTESVEIVNNTTKLVDPGFYEIIVGNSNEEDADTLLVQIYNLTVYPTVSKVKVDGKQVAFDAYNISGNNYFKLRDIAYVVNATQKQFDVTWDKDCKSIRIKTGEAYTAIGGEIAQGGKGGKSAKRTVSNQFIDQTEISLKGYNIQDNNYFKLRDIAERLDFGVTWDGSTNTVYIDTTTTNKANTQKTSNNGGTSKPAPAPAPSNSSKADSDMVGSLDDLLKHGKGPEGDKYSITEEEYHKPYTPVQ